jgi:hypothetical protein
MPELVVLPADLHHLDDLAHEFLMLLHEPDIPRGALCAVWFRIGLVLSDREACVCGLRHLIGTGVQGTMIPEGRES